MPVVDRARLHEVLTPVVASTGCDLEDVTVSAAGKRSVVRVVVDRDGGVDLDAVAEVSRAVSSALDESDVLGESPYVLEVTSPGVDRQLTAARHWSRAVGRLVSVPLTAGGEITGRVVSVEADTVTFDVDGSARSVSVSELGAGRVQVEFNRQEAAR